jgi:sn-glycerol 3-phosphate transport system permease protein
MPLTPGHDFLKNVAEAWARADLGHKILNSIVFAGGVALGKVCIAALSAFSLVFFRYRGRVVIFWLVFITLMLPLEVRIVPTYAVAANALSPYQTILDVIGVTTAIESLTGYRIALQWGLLNTYTGLILPLIATATGTFLYRQFFLTIPDELVEAAKMDGAGPLRFFKDILVPLSTTNIAALATIMFVWAWNQYLWPLLVTTDSAHGTAVMELRELIPGAFGIPDWNVAMAGTLVIMLPPLVVVVLMQRWFVRGLIATEK